MPPPPAHALLAEALEKGVGDGAVDPAKALQALRDGSPKEMLAGFLLGRSVALMTSLMDMYDKLRPHHPLQRGREQIEACMQRMDTLAKVYERMPTKVSSVQKRYYETWVEYSVMKIMVDHFCTIFYKADENGPTPASTLGGGQGHVVVSETTVAGGGTEETGEAK